MKRTVLLALAALLVIVVLPAYADEPESGYFAYVDLSTATVSWPSGGAAVGINGTCDSFNHVLGDWAGTPYDYTHTATVYVLGDLANYGECEFHWTTREKARRIVLRVEDTADDDSFEVWANRRGSWSLAYSYTDDPSTVQHIHEITRFASEKGRDPRVYIQIVPANPGDVGYMTHGQIAVDYVALYETR
jgi:hypothetical protein